MKTISLADCYGSFGDYKHPKGVASKVGEKHGTISDG